MESRDSNYYDLRAQDVKLEDITSSAHNAEILRMLRDNDIASIEGEEGALYIVDYDYDSNCDDFVIVKEGDDWGWLGYFIGRNKQIRDLRLYCLPKDRDQVDAFMEGMKHNRSVEEFDFHHVIEGDSIIENLASFITNSCHLKELRLVDIHFGFDCARRLAVALIQRQQKTLTRLSLKFNNLSNEALEEITAALSGYKQLESLCVEENLSRRDQKYYDMLAQIIDLKCITSSKKNAEIFRRLRDDAWDENEDLYITDYDSDCDEYFCAEEGDDWGWLGYFIGKNEQIRGLNLHCLPEYVDDDDAFMEGLCRNQSIEHLDIRRCDIDFSSLSPFIIYSRNLRALELWNVDVSLGNASNLAMALSQRQHKSLTRFVLSRNNLSSEALAEITAALTGYSSLESFDVSGNVLIGRDGCESLGAIIRVAAMHLEQVFHSDDNLDDEDLQTLVAALTNATTLRLLHLSRNRSITAAGLRALSQLFSSACPLETLFLEKINIGDEGAEALADGLRGNTTLRHLVLTPNLAGITNTGWAAFSRLLCDTSSINNTYRSNHTLEHIGDNYCYMSTPD
eukprot:scaffold526_cov71-Skeletonema_dohrnii-CCMP3373.AAC.1